MPKPRDYEYPKGFVPRARGAAAPLTLRDDDSAPTKELPVVREKKEPKDRREHTGEPKPTLPWAFWPKVLGLVVFLVLGISFLALNNFSFSAFMVAILFTLVAAGVFTFIYFLAKANKRDDDHSNPKQGADKVEDHRGH